MPVVVLSLTAVSIWALVAFVRRLPARGSAIAPVPVPVPCPPHRIRCRILFVVRHDDDLVLDCIAASDHPSLTGTTPGAPFTLRVSVFGSTWFADSMQRFLEGVAAEDRLVSFELGSGPDGDRLDVRSQATRMRFDLRSRAGLS